MNEIKAMIVLDGFAPDNSYFNTLKRNFDIHYPNISKYFNLPYNSYFAGLVSVDWIGYIPESELTKSLEQDLINLTQDFTLLTQNTNLDTQYICVSIDDRLYKWKPEEIEQEME